MPDKSSNLFHISTKSRGEWKRGDISSGPHLPHRLLVGLLEALPLGDGAMRHDGSDRGFISACGGGGNATI